MCFGVCINIPVPSGRDLTCSVSQVVEILSDSLTLPETPVPTKAARLMLVSDVLHNSTAQVPNASRYRSLLETALPDIFESLQVRVTLCETMGVMHFPPSCWAQGQNAQGFLRGLEASHAFHV
jgi:hypothetical protein